MAKTRKGFEDSLLVISIFGFAAITLNSFGKIDLSSFQTAVFMIAAGLGLLVEGQIKTFRQWSRNGIQSNEVPLILTLLVGFFSIIVGILALPFINVTNSQLQTVTGIVAAFALAFILLQRFVLD